jgi:hypothetical protein
MHLFRLRVLALNPQHSRESWSCDLATKIGPQEGPVESNHKLADYDRLLTSVLQYGHVVTIQSGGEPPADSRVSSLILLVLVALDQLDLSLLQEVCPSVTEPTGMISSQSLRSPTVHVFPLEGGALSWVAKLMLFHVINS